MRTPPSSAVPGPKRSLRGLPAILSLVVLLAAVLAPAAIANDNQASEQGQAGQELAAEKSADHSAAADEDVPAEQPRNSEDENEPEGENGSENEGKAETDPEDDSDSTGPSPEAQDNANENADQGLERAGSNGEDGEDNAADAKDNGTGNGDPAKSNENAARGQGNRGHIQLSSDGEAFPPNNEPHLPCVFYVNFYDFREGTEEAEVIFTAQPPSGGPGTPLGDYSPRTVTLDAQDEPGVTLNASQEYDLTDAVAGLERHPQQGYHIKLTVVTTPEDVSADEKHHVFWINCGETPPAPADLLVDKIVTGDTAPSEDTEFTFTVTCDGIDADVVLTDGDDAWSWNDDSGEDALTDDSECSIDEEAPEGATVAVTFNDEASAENTDEELVEGDNTFVVTNTYPANGGGGGGGGAAAANLVVDKIVTGDDAPGSTFAYSFTVTCGDDVAQFTLTDAGTWDWNTDSSHDDLTEDSSCSVDETTEDDADVTVTFNDEASAEGTVEALERGANTFVVTNDYPAETGVGGVDVETPVATPVVPVVPGETPVETPVETPNEGGVGGVGVERPTPLPAPEVTPVRPVTVPVAVLPAAQEAPSAQAAEGQLPRTGGSTTTLLVLALSLIGFGAVTVKQGRGGRASA